MLGGAGGGFGFGDGAEAAAGDLAADGGVAGDVEDYQQGSASSIWEGKHRKSTP